MSFWQRSSRKTLVQQPATVFCDGHADEVPHFLSTFGVSLLHRECCQRPKENVFISPISVFLALAMTENGAAGATKAVIRKALALPTDIGEKAVNESTVALLKSLRSQSGIELTIATALWTNIGLAIANEFVWKCQEIYDASVTSLDFKQPSTAAAINKWVAEKTSGKILEIVTVESVADLPTIITNAIYFKARFLHPFTKNETQFRDFCLASGRKKSVPMMRQSELSGAYRFGKQFEAAALHYADSTFVLFLLLPEKGVNPEEVLTEESLPDLFVKRGSVELDLSVPRFTTEFSSQLKESLKHMGMGIAFEYPGADFSAMGSQSLFIGEMLHKTLLQVDEEGTIAAAATTAMVELCALMPQQETLVFDRPFAVVMMDSATRVMIFAGVVYEP